MNEFYEHVKNEIKGIPCTVSISFDSLNIYENELFDFLSEDNSFHLLLFDKNQYYQKENNSESLDKRISDDITFFYKVNNQLYLYYTTINNNTIKSDKYLVSNMIIYSSINNRNELLKFTEKIGDFLKNKQ